MSTPARFFRDNMHAHRKALEMLGHPVPEAKGDPDDEAPETPAEHFIRTKEGQRAALEMLGHPRRPEPA